MALFVLIKSCDRAVRYFYLNVLKANFLPRGIDVSLYCTGYFRDNGSSITFKWYFKISAKKKRVVGRWNYFLIISGLPVSFVYRSDTSQLLYVFDVGTVVTQRSHMPSNRRSIVLRTCDKNQDHCVQNVYWPGVYRHIYLDYFPSQDSTSAIILFIHLLHHSSQYRLIHDCSSQWWKLIQFLPFRWKSQLIYGLASWDSQTSVNCSNFANEWQKSRASCNFTDRSAGQFKYKISTPEPSHGESSSWNNLL